MRTLIVGGVAGGATAAARLRRLDERMEIVIYERGEYVSFANCGLPYHIGGAIRERSALLVQTPEGLRERFALDVRTRHEVIAIDRARKVISVRNLATGEAFEDRYDHLVLSPGAAPARPPVPGADLPGIRTLRTMHDMDAILADLGLGARSAVVIGGGFIGVEMAEALAERGLSTTIVEAAPQVLLFLDPDMAAYAQAELVARGVALSLGARLERISAAPGGGYSLSLAGRPPLGADLVVLAAGVRPETSLAEGCGLAIGPTGGIRVDAAMRTSDPAIFAVGDAVEVTHLVTGRQTRIPLAGPANRQARVAAEAIAGRATAWKPLLGTSIVKVFDLACAATGANAVALRAAGIAFRSAVVHAGSHAGYFPGATPVHLKVHYAPADGRLLGAQAVGTDGADKRIDVIAGMMRLGATVRDLAECELCYAPPYGAAKDPVNLAGFVALNDLDGLAPLVDVETLPGLLASGAAALDVRSAAEVACGTITGALSIPLPELRRRLAEVPRDRPVVVFCKVGLRGYVAQRILRQNGIEALNLTGGYDSYRILREWDRTPGPAKRERADDTQTAAAAPCAARQAPPRTHAVDARGLQCPGPLLRLKEAVDRAAPGDVVEIEATEAGFAADVAAFAEAGGHELVSLERGKVVRARLSVAARPPSAALAAARADGALTIVVFSNDLDRAMAAFIIANGALAMGRRVSLFFTFWGLNLLRRDDPPPVRKSLVERMFGFMMPRGARGLALSKMHMFGMGTGMMRGIMAAHRVETPGDLLAGLLRGGAKIVACAMTMELMGIRREEVIDGVEFGGVATYLADAGRGGHNLFI